ncbi:GAF domain-containing sensor histidine kinase [Ilumatobacter sp.]|uniref:sensor histidine kinase n=1 Tax=Ilumatobacter sp. TaxID=1967498 RepID=UPI003C6A1A33
MTTDSARSSHTCRVAFGPDSIETGTARSPRLVRHDLAGALNVIGLAAEVGRSGVIDPLDALQQIAGLVEEASEHLDALPPSTGATPSPEPTGFGLANVDQATAQASILEGVVRHVPLAESLDAIVAAIENQLPHAACSVLLLRHGRTLHHGAAAKLPAAYCDGIDGVQIGLGQGSCGTAAFTGRPVIASDVTTDENWVQFRDLASAHGVRSCWSTPIVAERGEVLGTFAVYTAGVWFPDETAVQLVERFTYLAAIAIEHHRLFGADASNKAKTDFLTLVSHELRTPLNAILGFAQVMQMVELDPDQRADSVDQIVRAGQHLRDLIDDLLDLSRIEAGQLSVVAEDLESGAVIGEVLDLVRPLATERDIELIVPPTVDAHRVHADQRCVRQVLINLIANAVKYTPVGGRVRVEVAATIEKMVRISITDSGPGISSESMAELFQPFHRLDHDQTTEPKGTGLGLALSARLMDEMGGRIGVDSTPGTGSCFWVELPRNRPTPGDPSSSTMRSDRLSRNGANPTALYA